MENNRDVKNRVGFHNRAIELQNIQSSVKPQLVVDAPSGYGKSFLLDEVLKRYQKDAWKCVRLDLNHVHGVKNIATQILVGLQEGKHVSHVELDPAKFALELLNNASVLLIVDSVDRAAPEDIEWLLKIIDIRKGLQPRFRAIYAGRYLSKGPHKKVLSAFEPFLVLSPFTSDVVRDLLQDEIESTGLKTSLPNYSLEQVAKDIAWISGGHPKSIACLVEYAINADLNIDFSTTEQKRYLFSECVSKKYSEILDSSILSASNRNTLETLSVFRYFNTETIIQLQQRDLLDKELDPFGLIAQLGSLVSKDRFGFYSDDIIRNLSVVQQQLFDPVGYAKLNRVAQTVFDSWIDKIIDEGIWLIDPVEASCAFAQESLYHSVQQIVVGEAGIHELLASIRSTRNRLQEVADKYDSPLDAHMVIEEIMVSDTDIVTAFSFGTVNISSEILMALAFGSEQEQETSSGAVYSQYTSSIFAIQKHAVPEPGDNPDAGTGYFIRFNKRNFVLTCAHVLKSVLDSDTIAIGDEVSIRHFPTNETYEAKVAWIPDNIDDNTAHLDVALLEPHGKLPPTLSASKTIDRVGDANEVEASEHEQFVYFGYAKSAKPRGRTIRGLRYSGEGAGGFLEYQITNEDVQPEHGDSGAPLLDNIDRRVIGLVNGYRQSTVYVIPINIVHDIVQHL